MRYTCSALLVKTMHLMT